MSTRRPVSDIHASSGNRVSAEPSPNPVRRTSTPTTSFRKRPGISSRGNSPPGKRPRPGDASKYPARSPTGPFNPQLPGENFARGGDHMPTNPGPAPRPKDGSRGDFRPGLDTNQRRESLRPSDNGTPGSGNTTPQHAAPPAPPMLAAAQGTVSMPTRAKLPLQTLANIVNTVNAERHMSQFIEHEMFESSDSGTVASLRNIQARKRAIAAKEHAALDQNLGDSVLRQIQNVAAEKTGSGSLSDEERATFNRVQAEAMDLRAEVESLKREQANTLDDLVKLKKVHQDTTQALSARLDLLENVPDGLSDLDTRVKSIDQLRPMLDKLDQWRKNHPEPCTIEEVRREITHQTTPAETAMKENLATQNTQIKDTSLQVDTLLQFKKLVKEADWPKQLQVAKDRIEQVSEREKETFAEVGRIEDKLNKIQDNVTGEIERVTLHVIEENLESWKEPENGKKLESRVELLESKVDKVGKNMGNIGTRQPTMTISTEVATELEKQFCTLESTFEGFRKTIQATDEPQIPAVADLNKRVQHVEQSPSLAEGIETTLADLGRRMSTAEQSFPLATHLEAKFKASSSRLDREVARIDMTISNTDDALQTRLRGVEGATEGLSEDLDKAEKDVHELTNKVETVEQNVIRIMHTKLQKFKADLGGEIQAAKATTTLQNTFAEQQQLQSMTTNLENTVKEWQANFATLSNQVNTLITGCHDLEVRYDNISTANLHQQMVHWFVQNYPTAGNIIENLKDMKQKNRLLYQEQDKLIKLASISQELTSMAQYWDPEHWDPEQLAYLMQNSATLQQLALQSQSLLQLAQDDSGMTQLPALEQKLENASRDASKALTLNEELEMKSNGHETELATLSTIVTTMQNDAKSQQTTIQEELGKQISDWDAKVASMLADADLEKVQKFCAMLPQLILAIHEMRQVIDDLNANLEGGGLRYNFLNMDDIKKEFAPTTSGQPTA